MNHLPAETLSRISNEIEQLHFECQLIVASHTKTGYRIFTIDSKGTVLQADGYAVIGSGSWIAQASLCQRQYSQNFTMPTAAYVIYEAKKLAENEPTVGKRTAMWVTHHRHGVIGLMDGSLLLPSEDARSATRGPDLLGSWFNLYGPQQIPNLEFPAGAIKWHPYDLPKGASLKKDEEETISRGSVLNFV